jgi:hypothetical protein
MAGSGALSLTAIQTNSEHSATASLMTSSAISKSPTDSADDPELKKRNINVSVARINSADARMREASLRDAYLNLSRHNGVVAIIGRKGKLSPLILHS